MAKKKYEVLHDFIDLEDTNKKISDERISELSTSNNRRGKALIKELEE